MKFNKRLFALFIAFLYTSLLLGQYNPIPDQRAVVNIGGCVRFTVLTPCLVRMEWNDNGHFTNDASFLVVNRNLKVPYYKVVEKNGLHIVETDSLVLRYQRSSGKFNPENLSVQLKFGNKTTWYPGLKQKQNLKGTTRTLDRCDGDSSLARKQPISLEDGILARDGWSFFDDSKNFLLDNSDWPWVAQRQDTTGLDWYFMGYGSDYKRALYDFTLVSGKQPLPPRYAFGFWWSRYWSYSDNELRDVVDRFERYNIPPDVLVLDMDWHNTDSIGSVPDEFGQRKWWTGWTWNNRLFPDPQAFLRWLHRKNIKATLNLHPASGVAPFEVQYNAFAEKMNFDTSGRRNIPFDGSNKKFMQTLFDVVLRPMEKQGVDFWWLDWQQWLEDRKVKNLQNTWWLNYTFFTDMERNRNTRPLLYHRWGGMGNHRYQVGFSGDVIISWKSLDYQSYFTNTASNVLYGYYSHDIGGHTYGKQGVAIDPELQTRWVQYGALSPVFRIHSSKNPLLNKEPWAFSGSYFDVQYKAIKLRYMLAPYIYTMARYAYDKGISLCRPMYYDYPDHEDAYKFDRQYLFGNDVLVAPIGSPAVDQFSTVKVWLPEGDNWYEWHTGSLLKGGQIVTRKFSLDEYPIYLKAGAIIPMYMDNISNLEANPQNIKLGVFPGQAGASTLYEDNGNNQQYATQYSNVDFQTSVHKDGSLMLSIHPVKGSFSGMHRKRNYEIILYGSSMPSLVSVDGKSISYTNNYNDEEGWQYIGAQLSSRIFIKDLDVDKKHQVHISYTKGDVDGLNDGMVEKMKRLGVVLKKMKEKEPNLVIPHWLGKAEETNRLIEYQPQNFKTLVTEFQQIYKSIPSVLKETPIDTDTQKWILGYLDLLPGRDN